MYRTVKSTDKGTGIWISPHPRIQDFEFGGQNTNTIFNIKVINIFKIS